MHIYIGTLFAIIYDHMCVYIYIYMIIYVRDVDVQFWDWRFGVLGVSEDLGVLAVLWSIWSLFWELQHTFNFVERLLTA